MKRKLLWVLVLFAVITYGLSAVLYLVQMKLHLPLWVFNLASVGPFLGALVAWLVGRRLDWPVRLTAKQGLSPALIRRWMVTAFLAVSILLLAVQAYTFVRWGLKPRRLDRMTHPLALPQDQTTLFLLVLAGFAVSLALEEFAWRVFLQPTLHRFFNTFITAAIVAVAWAGFQFPQFLSGILERHNKYPGWHLVILFAAAYLVALFGQSMILMLSLQKMKRGQWVAAWCFRFVYAVGFWLILDEETGRWQAMGVIALASVAGAAAAYYYWNRSELPWPTRPRSATAEKQV